MFRLDGHTLNSFMQSFDEYDIQGICKGTERRIADKEDGHNVSDAIFSYASSSTLKTIKSLTGLVGWSVGRRFKLE